MMYLPPKSTHLRVFDAENVSARNAPKTPVGLSYIAKGVLVGMKPMISPMKRKRKILYYLFIIVSDFST